MNSSISGFSSGGSGENKGGSGYDYKTPKIIRKGLSKIPHPASVSRDFAKGTYGFSMGIIAILSAIFSLIAYTKYKRDNPDSKDDMGDTIKKVLNTRVL